MATHSETVLCAHLTTVESLDYLALEGFLAESSQEVIPTELIRELLAWTLRYYFSNGRTVAPSKEAILEVWGEKLEDAEIVIDDDTETDSIQWAVAQLRAQHATFMSQAFVREFATLVTKAGPDEKVKAIQTGAHELLRLSQVLVSHRKEQNAADGFLDAIERYVGRAESGNTVEGLTFGLPEIDQHLFGVHDGEMAIVGAGSGIGKSWLGSKTTLNEWRQKRRCALFTLENDLPMTFDRMACMQARVDYTRWQSGEAHDEELERVKLITEQLMNSEHAPIVLMPERGIRTPSAMVRKAIVLGADSLVIDQLSFVEHLSASAKRWERFSETIHALKEEISEGSERLPLVLLHQINREGIAAARKTGRFYMDHMAEAAEIERTADFVFAIYQSDDDKIIGQAQWQTLKARRVPPKDWDLAWRLDKGDIRVRGEVIREAS